MGQRVFDGVTDLLVYDTTSDDGFLNGRRLEDDVIDAELGLLTLGAVAGDGVDANDVPFRDVFPYLAQQHTIPEPSGIALALVSLPAAYGFLRRRRPMASTSSKR